MNEMTLTLLLDLDDTLLSTGTDRFIRSYLARLGAYLEPFTGKPASLIIDRLLKATSAMLENDQPDITLEQAFNEVFYPALGTSSTRLKPAISDFYSRIYPSLESSTERVPGADAFIEKAQVKGWKLAVATNPLFPQTAVSQRLDWAGLPAREGAYEVVSSYEDFHFAKPNPAYFAEIYSRTGCGDSPVLVAGDDLEKDILPARLAGFPVFQVLGSGTPPAATGSRYPSGSLQDLDAWLEKADPDSLCPQLDSTSAITAQLKASPAVLDVFASSVEGSQLVSQPAPGEWSLTEIFCHLRDVECEVNLPRLLQVTRQDNPFLAAVDTDVWASQRKYIRQDGLAALREFIRARKESLSILASLPPAGWQKAFRHAIFGQTTIQDLTGFTATHDRVHIQQAYRLIHPPSPG